MKSEPLCKKISTIMQTGLLDSTHGNERGSGRGLQPHNWVKIHSTRAILYHHGTFGHQLLNLELKSLRPTWPSSAITILRACLYEKALPAFGPLCRGPRFAGAEILLCLYEGSSHVCRGSNGPCDIVFMCMTPVIGF